MVVGDEVPRAGDVRRIPNTRLFHKGSCTESNTACLRCTTGTVSIYSSASPGQNTIQLYNTIPLSAALLCH